MPSSTARRAVATAMSASFPQNAVDSGAEPNDSGPTSMPSPPERAAGRYGLNATGPLPGVVELAGGPHGVDRNLSTDADARGPGAVGAARARAARPARRPVPARR